MCTRTSPRLTCAPVLLSIVNILRDYAHKVRFYCDAASIEVVWMTPPCCLPTSSFPFFLSSVFTTHSSSSSIHTIYESSDPKGEMLHSVDYFHLVFPHERHSLTLLLSLFISLFGLFVLLSPKHENWTPTSVAVMLTSPLWSGGLGEFAHWIRSRSHLPWSQWEQLALHTAHCCGNALTYRFSSALPLQGAETASMSGDMYNAGYQSITKNRLRLSEYDLASDGHPAALVPRRILWSDPGEGHSGRHPAGREATVADFPSDGLFYSPDSHRGTVLVNLWILPQH